MTYEYCGLNYTNYFFALPKKVTKNSSPKTKRTVHYGFAHLKTFVFLTAHKFYRRLVFCVNGQFIIYGSRTIVIVCLWPCVSFRKNPR